MFCESGVVVETPREWRRAAMERVRRHGAIVDAELLARVCGEYLEMPGLRLTVAQASRLWNLEETRGSEVLETLVRTSFLRRSGNCYVRADSGN
jgi:hypothetical protein